MLQPGTRIGRYEIQRRLGRGGMGTVYVAHDPVLGRLVAIKLFQADLEIAEASTRFAREARAAAALNHANIVTVHDFGEHDAEPFIVMEYIQGETLAAIIRSKAPISIIDKVTWLEQLCAGAAYAHNLGVIHRDIKPTNLIVDRTRRLKILDFGIAKLLGAVGSHVTGPVGTPGYMAPEQILGEPIDRRSDVFSIGVVAYELFTGAEAFPGDSVPAITHRILTQEPKSLTDVSPDLPAALVDVVERAMSKKADARFENADAFRTALVAARAHVDVDRIDTMAPTIIRPAPSFTPPPGGRPASGGRPGTGPVRATPGPVTNPTPGEPTRGDRQKIEQLRVQQLASSLADARSALAAGDLDRAQNACLQALLLKPDDPDALSLEEQIEIAQARKRATELVDEARDELGRGGLTGAFELLEQARTLDPDFAELKVLERDLRLARADHDRLRKKTESVQLALDASARALGSGDVEGALAFARQALDLKPDSPAARDAEMAALLRLDEETGASATRLAWPSIPADTVIAPAGRHPMSPAPPPAPVSAPVKQTPKVALRASPVAAQQKKLALIGGAVLLVLAAAAGAFMLMSPGTAATGSVALDAVPYAVVSTIENTAGGARPALPADPSTPVILHLPVGTYRVGLTGPPPASESRTITVTVTRDATTTVPAQRFTSLTPEEYFEPYLSAATPATVDPAATPAPAQAAP